MRAPRFHHVGIQTVDLENSLSWYRDFFGCRQTWSLDTFSELTRGRLPGIVRLAELVLGDIHIHLFERDGRDAPYPGESVVQFQHVCLSVDSAGELASWHRHWTELFESGRYEFAFADPATDIVTDPDGASSFYALDVNGLEFEFTHIPSGAR